MKFWCFHFEGVFKKDSLEHPEQGCFSSCLVSATDFDAAKVGFVDALLEIKISLIEIQESFPVGTDPDEMDPDLESNQYWIQWCQETEIADKPTFEAFNLYPKDEVNPLYRERH